MEHIPVKRSEDDGVNFAKLTSHEELNIKKIYLEFVQFVTHEKSTIFSCKILHRLHSYKSVTVVYCK